MTRCRWSKTSNPRRVRPDEHALLVELGSQVQSALTTLSPELREGGYSSRFAGNWIQ